MKRHVIDRAIGLGSILLVAFLPAGWLVTARTVAAMVGAPRDARVAAPAGAVCSPRDPLNPPVIATLPVQGSLVLDERHGMAIVASASDTAGASRIWIGVFNTLTGARLRARTLTLPPVVRSWSHPVLTDAFSIALDSATGRLFLLHQPFAQNGSPPGRIDVVDEQRLSMLRSTWVGSIALAPLVDERTGRVFVANQQSGTLSVLDGESGHLLRTVRLTGTALDPSAAPILDSEADRVLFAESSARGHLDVIDGRSGQLLRRLAVGAFPQALALDGGHGRVLVANNGDATLSIVDLWRGRLLRTQPLPGAPTGVMVSVKMHRAFVSYGDNEKVSMVDTANGRILRTIPVRMDHDAHGRPIRPPQQGSVMYPVLNRIDERRHWAVVQLPEESDDDGPEPASAQITMLDTRTGNRVSTVFAVAAWPLADAVDDRRGRAFTANSSGIAVYDISCLNSYYVFADL